METQQLTANRRDERGKGAARQARRDGLIPAVVYGNDVETTAISVDPTLLRQALSGPYGKNAVINLSVEGDGDAASHEVMVKDYQKHPVSRALLHADFFVIDPEDEVVVDVPLTLVGRARGVAMGGKLRQVRRTVTVRCRPADIPTEIVYDVTRLRIKQRAQVSQITAPENVALVYDNDFAIAQINTPRGATDIVDDEDDDETTGEE